MELDVFFKWLFESAIGAAIRENESLFPWIESFHVLAVTIVVGSIAVVDLRLLGFASLDRTVTKLTGQVLPCTWIAFAVAAVTGVTLFTSNAVNYAHNFYFQWKMVLLILAGCNMVVFHFLGSRGIERWGSIARPPLPAKAAGAISLILWVGVIGFGRWIGFSLQPTISG
jgi:hypothetical protein